MPLRVLISLVLLFCALGYAFFKIRKIGRIGIRGHAKSGFPSGPPAARSPAARPSEGGREPRTHREEKIKTLIRAIPKGRVVTFAALSAHAGPGFEVLKISREVRAFSSEKELPWWRVVRRDGRRGMVSSSAELANRQRALLEAEGIEFKGDTFNLAKYQWEP